MILNVHFFFALMLKVLEASDHFTDFLLLSCHLCNFCFISRSYHFELNSHFIVLVFPFGGQIELTFFLKEDVPRILHFAPIEDQLVLSKSI